MHYKFSYVLLIFLSLFLSVNTAFSQDVWVSGTAYTAGAEVVSDNINFQAKTAIAASYTQPIYAPTEWMVLWVDNSDWVSNVYYEEGHIVKYNEVLFQANTRITNAGCSPLDCGSAWNILWTDYSEWIPNVFYQQGDIVTYNSQAYQAYAELVDRSNTPVANCGEWVRISNEAIDLIWESGLTVTEGTIVSYNSLLYLATQALDCNDGNRYTSPDQLTNYWSVISAEEIAEQKNQWLHTDNKDGLFYINGNVGVGIVPDSKYAFTIRDKEMYQYNRKYFLQLVNEDNNPFFTIDHWFGGPRLSMYHYGSVDQIGTILEAGKLRLQSRSATDYTDFSDQGISIKGGGVEIHRGDATNLLTPSFKVATDGRVSMGTIASDGYALTVKGGIATDKVKVKTVEAWQWPDYVFAKEYSLMPLSELKTFVETNKHLPNVPSASDVAIEGIELVEMNRVLLEKVEEMTLYMIEMQTQLQEAQKEIKELQGQVQEIK